MKETKAELVKRLERAFAVEDDFPGYLGNPRSLGIVLPSMRRKATARRRASTPRRSPVSVVR